MGSVWKVLTRRKIIENDGPGGESQLRRVLNTVDLTALGIGSTLGVGVYVLAGHVAKDTAGPAVILSFLIAAIASVFAGLCYAEFGARVPKAGSAYIYSYVCVGEFIAFVIGWNLVLEYVIGSASVARGLSLYLDTLLNNTLKDTFTEIAPINVEFMSQYFDFFAFGISILLSVGLAFGLKESTKVNNIFTLLNLGVVIFVIIAGAIKADGHNWDLPVPKNRTHVGTGGFMPFGISGVIKGAATCFYGFVGFDCIATSGEEVKNPQKAIPTSIILSLLVIFLAYFGTSTVVTLMVPYYDQDPNAPIPHAFEMVDWEVAKWVVAIGGIFGLCASLFGAMFPLPRIIYAMASDGLVFRFLGKVNARFQTPVTGTLLAGLLTGLMAALFELKQLVNMMSIGTLLAYTIVAASVLLLRYEDDRKSYELLRTTSSESSDNDSETYTESRDFGDGTDIDESQLVVEETVTPTSVVKQIFNCGRTRSPTKVSEKIVNTEVFIYCVLCVLIGLCAMYLTEPLSKGEIWAIALTSVTVGLTVLVLMSIATQPKSNKELSFRVPLLPIIPALSILMNIYLMLMLDTHTWIRFAVWMAVGLPIYYFSVSSHYHDARNMSVVTLTPPLPSSSSTPPPPKIMVNGIGEEKKLDQGEIDVLKNFDQILDSVITDIDLDKDVKVNSGFNLNNRSVDSGYSESDDSLEFIPQIVEIPQAKIADFYEVSPRLEMIEEIEEEADNRGAFAPPPPPPFSQTIYDMAAPIPRLNLSANLLKSNKLKKTKRAAPEIPQIRIVTEQDDDNLKFDSLEYRVFRERLVETLQPSRTPPIGVVFPQYPVVNDEDREAAEPNEDVVEEGIDKDNVKVMLNSFLSKRENGPPPFSLDTQEDPKMVESDQEVSPLPEIEPGDERSLHKERMLGTLRSIRLRKVDSFKNEET